MKSNVVAALVLLLAVLTAESLGKTIDLSNMTDATGLYNIAFCARSSPDPSGKPGHAFVSYSHQTPSGDRDFVSIGHTVSAGTSVGSGIWSYFSHPIPGLLKEEMYTSIKQNCLDVVVNKSDYQAAWALAQDPLHKMGLTAQEGTVFQGYKLGAEDCITFLMAVAQTLKPRGLKVPARGNTELPLAYIARFIAAN